jgi:hypothetical protein
VLHSPFLTSPKVAKRVGAENPFSMIRFLRRSEAGKRLDVDLRLIRSGA